MHLFDICQLGMSTFGHPQFRQLSIADVVIPDIVEPKDETKSNTDALFDLVFALNPQTLLPDGDLAMFMSENTSPEIREFIRQQIMSPSSIKSDSSGFEGLSDDDIATFTRGLNESIESYRNRLVDVVKNSSVLNEEKTE